MITLNVGSWDRWLRIAIGIGIVSLQFWGPKSGWAWFGVIPLATGLFRYCPAYTLVGISTCKTEGFHQ